MKWLVIFIEKFYSVQFYVSFKWRKKKRKKMEKFFLLILFLHSLTHSLAKHNCEDKRIIN